MHKITAPATDSGTIPLMDGWDRRIDYLRIAVTDRCNLRCTYCMPPEGIRFLPQRELLTSEEILRIGALFARLGVAKIRITGGEPFVRRDLIGLVQRLQALPSIRHLHFTTNGVLAGRHLEQLRQLEIGGLNLSLDSLRRKRFREITGRDALPRVMATLRRGLELGIPFKINTVVLPANLDELPDLAGLAKEHPLEVIHGFDRWLRPKGRPASINQNRSRTHEPSRAAPHRSGQGRLHQQQERHRQA